jgi:hypothetical protein
LIVGLYCAPAMSGELIGHWHFNQCDGQTVTDRSASGNDGRIEYGQLQQEKGCTSLEFDGLGGCVTIAGKTPLLPVAALSTALWVKPARLSNSTVLFGIPHVRQEWTTPVFGMYGNQQRVVYGMWLDGKRMPKVLLESPQELPLGAWTFLASTYDGTMVRLYVNGRRVAEAPAAGRIVPNGQALLLGQGQGASKPPFRGRLGELRIYSRGLSAAEVQALYVQTKANYDLAVAAAKDKDFGDGTVVVETHSNSPSDGRPWRAQPTRTLDLLAGYHKAADRVKLDRFGGCMDWPRERATGFFYAKKIDGRQWLIDPEGYRFYHIALNTVFPPKNVQRVFGSAEGWGQSLAADMRGAGFNGQMGRLTPEQTRASAPAVWVWHKNFMFAFTKQKKLSVPASGTSGFIDKCMPVFHPEFAPFCDRCARDLAQTANDPYLLGYMTDNEIQCPGDLLNRYLALDASHPDLKPNRDAAIAWLTARRGSADPARIDRRDQFEFIAFAFERYYRIVTAAIRRYDPHHLYLGSRINYRGTQLENPLFWKMLAKYHDVVSVNYYSVWGPDRSDVANWEAWADRPILITEWYAKALDVPGLANTFGAGWLVRTQADRARYYQHFVLRTLECRNIVGYHWFKYRDDPPESTALDCAGGANKGMFDADGRPYKLLLNAAREVNREAYPLIRFFDQRNR